jgi:hypothetical protein
MNAFQRNTINSTLTLLTALLLMPLAELHGAGTNDSLPVAFGNGSASWNFDEGSGTVAQDDGNQGKLVDKAVFVLTDQPSAGKPAWSTDTPHGTVGHSVHLSRGSSGSQGGYLRVADSEDVSFSSDEVTLEAWVKIQNTTITHPIINKWSTDSEDKSYLLEVVPMAGSARVRFQVSTDGSAEMVVAGSPISAIPAGQWTHLAGAIVNTDVGKRMVVYRDGVEVGRAIAPRNFRLHRSSNQLWMGRRGDDVAEAYVDSVRIYHYGQNPIEIQYGYKSVAVGATDESAQLSSIARARQLPPGVLAKSAVSLSSRWERPVVKGPYIYPNPDPYDTLKAAMDFHATRLDWTYLTCTDPVKDRNYITKMHSGGFTVSAGVNNTDVLGKEIRNIGRIIDANGKRVVSPSLSPTFYIGCANSGEFRAIWQNHARYNVDAGADFLQQDAYELTNYTAVHWGGCYCDDCVAGFRTYLVSHLKSQQLAGFGITDLGAFNYRQYILGGGKDATLRSHFVAFQEQSSVRFYHDMFAQLDAYAGRHVPVSCNNGHGGWSRLTEQFDYGMAEYWEPAYFGVSDSTLVPYVKSRYMNCESRGKAQLFTLVSMDVGLNRKMIAACYASGGHMIAPWDVCTGSLDPKTPRWFGEPRDFVGMFKLVRSYPEFFDGYEDAAFFNPRMPDYRYGAKPAAWTSESLADVYVLVRSKPGQREAAVVIHLIDMRKAPGVFRLSLARHRFFGNVTHRLTLYRPDEPPRKLPAERGGADGLLNVMVPALDPWGLLVVEAGAKS